MARLAERAGRITTSATQAVTTTVDRLRRAGVEVIDLGAGEPDFPTVEVAKIAAHEAIDANFTKYTPNAGTAELRRAICERLRTDYGVEYGEAEVIVSAGGKQALYNAAMALFGPGDEVITHAPYWPTIPEQIALADATPVIAQTDAADGFAIHAACILDRVTSRTRGIIVNSPCNPTGAVIAESELETIAAFCGRRSIWVIADLTYEKLIYDPLPHNLPAVLARYCRDTAVICGSASKAYAMTGWRCGWAVGPEAAIAAAAAIQSHVTSNASSIAQKAVVAALTGSQEPVRAMLDEYRIRRDRLHAWLAEDARLKCHKPRGAFYMLVDVREALAASRLASSIDFASALLDEAHVALTPGEGFGAPGFVRISYATSMDNLREGSRRIVDFVRARTAAAAVETAKARSL
jgi:aspartate aminotransferase